MRRMASLQVNIPEQLKSTAEARAEAAGFASVDEYVASLIESDQAEAIDPQLEAELLKGLDSGPPIDVTPQFWDDLKKRVRQRRGSNP